MVAKTVVRPTQTAFMPGRNIMEGVVILHETIHELHTKKRDGVIFKIDFEKAYDKVKWSFFTTNATYERFLPQMVSMGRNYGHRWECGNQS
jgi:hypothetical protein